MMRRRLLPVTGNPLAYAVVLDEAIALYRQHWRTFVAVALLWLVPADLIELAPELRAALAPPSTVVQTQRDTALSSAVSVVGVVASAWMSGATTVLVLGLLQGRPVSVFSASATAVHHAGGLLLGTFAQLVLVTVLLVLSGALTLVAAVVGLGGLVPLLLLIVWGRLPRRRTPLLKWLIVYLTPLGPVAYFFVSLNLWQPILMLEDIGAFASL